MIGKGQMEKGTLEFSEESGFYPENCNQHRISNERNDMVKSAFKTLSGSGAGKNGEEQTKDDNFVEDSEKKGRDLKKKKKKESGRANGQESQLIGCEG